MSISSSVIGLHWDICCPWPRGTHFSIGSCSFPRALLRIRYRSPFPRVLSAFTSDSLGPFFSSLREIVFLTYFFKKLYIDLWIFSKRLRLLKNKTQKDMQTFSTFCPITYLPWGTELPIWLKAGVIKEGKKFQIIVENFHSVNTKLLSTYYTLDLVLCLWNLGYILFICCEKDRHNPCSGAYALEKIDIKKWLKWVIAQLHLW